MLERSRSASEALRSALLAEVRRRAGKVELPESPPPAELRELTLTRVTPMVRGLFPAREQAAVLALLEESVVFLTPANLEQVLRGESYDHSAWTLANLYLGSVGAEILGGREDRLLGMSQGTTCYVTARYLEGRAKFDDFLVHEAAHVFHNWKRERAGLPHTRYKEWLLPIAFVNREPFAFACERYARILEQGRTKQEREALLAEYAEHPFASDDDIEEHLDVLREAVAATNGWKRILARCSEPLPRPRAPLYRRDG
jgi:hypothetical protein